MLRYIYPVMMGAALAGEAHRSTCLCCCTVMDIVQLLYRNQMFRLHRLPGISLATERKKKREGDKVAAANAFLPSPTCLFLSFLGLLRGEAGGCFGLVIELSWLVLPSSRDSSLAGERKAREGSRDRGGRGSGVISRGIRRPDFTTASRWTAEGWDGTILDLNGNLCPTMISEVRSSTS